MLINKQDTQNIIQEYIEIAQRIKCKDAEDMLMDLADDVRNLRSAEPERMKGQWLPAFGGESIGGTYWFECSKCKRIVPEVRNCGWNYCPKCEADMRPDNAPLADDDSIYG